MTRPRPTPALPLRTAADDRGRHVLASDVLPQGRISKIFTPGEVGDASFEVELKRSGRVYEILPARPSSTCCLRPAKTPMHDCKRGVADLPDPIEAFPIIAITS